MDNLGAIVSEVGDVVIIGKKVYEFPLLRGERENKKERKRKRKEFRCSFYQGKEGKDRFRKIRRNNRFFVFCKYVLITTLQRENSSWKHLEGGFIVRAWISVSCIRCSRQGMGLKADTIPDEVVFLIEDSRFSV